MTNPEVRKVRLRLEGDDQDVQQVAAMLGNLLPTMSQNLYQVGEASPPYANRRGPGVRRYVDLYVLRAPGTDHAGDQAPEAPGTAVRPASAPQIRRGRP